MTSLPLNSFIRLSEARIIDTPEFKEWYKDSLLVDSSGNPIKLYRGIHRSSVRDFMKYPKDQVPFPADAIKGLPNKGNATFCVDNPDAAKSYASFTTTAFYVKALELIPYRPVKSWNKEMYDWQAFDAKAITLKPGEVLVAHNVQDHGPAGGEFFHTNIYAFGPGTEVVNAFNHNFEIFNSIPKID